MMAFLRFFPIIIYLPVGIYFYFVFRRFLELFGVKKGSWPSRILCVIFPVCCAAAGWRVYDLGAVLVMHFLVISLIMEVVNWIVRRVSKDHTGGRRWSVVYRSSVVAVLGTALILGYGCYHMQQVQKTVYTLETDKALPGGQLTIAQISDLHAGTVVAKDKLQEYCDDIAAEQPDIVALTGDIFDESTTREEMEATAKILSGIDAAYGIYYVFGNHDYNSYVREANYTPDELADTLEGLGIHVLRDEAVEAAPGVEVIGRVDASRERALLAELMPEDEETFTLVLDHQPYALREAAGAGVDLQLSGHTHAGQIWPTGQLNSLINPNRVNYGLRQDGDYRIIVSSGIAGWGYAIRTGGSSEYVIIRVESTTTGVRS